MSESVEASARRIRAVRGVLAATVATLVALIGHLSGGGAVPSGALIAATLVLSWLPGIALIGVRPRLWRQAATIIVAQVMLHGLFTLESVAGAVGDQAQSGGRGMAAMPGMAGAFGSLHASALSTSALSTSALSTSTVSMTASPAASPMAGMAGSGWPMWVGHAVAALITIALWRHGESCCVALLRLARAGLQRVVEVGRACPLEVRGAVRAAPQTVAPVRFRMRAGASVSRRGPPSAAFAFVV